MQAVEERQIHCPYCGEPLAVLIDCSVDHQNYIEDCQVCCRPIVFDVRVDFDGSTNLRVSDENES